MSKITFLPRAVTFCMSLLLLIATHQAAQAQGFKGSVVAGLNLAQIDGDDLYGYNKLGFTGGFKLDYPVHQRVDMSLEMLFSEKGSTDGFGFGSPATSYTSLRYLDLPIMVSIKDWFIEDANYHKVSAHAGLNFGYLFDAKSTNGAIPSGADFYRQVDVSYFFGVNYRFNRRIGLTLRHTRAFNSLLPASVAISYFVTTRVEYYF